MQLKIYGIRHHGPGSSRSLNNALDQFQPDIILVEGAPELDSIYEYTKDSAIEPPIAALLYHPKDLKQAVYYPYTCFSPEWQAYQYAQKHSIILRHLDLPQSLSFGLQAQPERLLDSSNQDESTISAVWWKDPLGYLAAMAGYKDSERWWEVMFEHGNTQIDLFETILEMMTALRVEVGNKGQGMNFIREAYMRKILRKSIKEGFQKIAVVCGAWHGPALANYQAYKVSADNALIKGIPKLPIKATWIAWTYERIATSSGYGAGVLAPAWYELLFTDHQEASILWMSKVAQLFQDLDIATSSAQAIDAVRLAQTLASLRRLEVPGIDELKEAVQTIFSAGTVHQLELIKQRLIIGDRLGTIPASIPLIPLQQDIDQSIKRLKLIKYKITTETWIKASASRPRGGLDLRQEHDRNQSQFLHRLNLIGIRWGRVDRATGRELSTKNEYWKMHWNPDFSIKIIEAGMWGNTLEQACIMYLEDKTGSTSDSLVEMTQLLQQVIHANLPEAMFKLVQQLRHIAAVAQDINHLMEALPPLVQVTRYGDVRNTAVSMVRGLLNEIIPRICLSLSAACLSLDETAERSRFDRMQMVNQALSLLEKKEFTKQWRTALLHLAQNEAIGGLIKGFAARVVFDCGLIAPKKMGTMMSYALSPAVKVNQACLWVEGYLYGSGLLLIHHPSLWQIIDRWLIQLKDQEFQETLPLLRKTFAAFSEAERSKMYDIVENGQVEIQITKTLELQSSHVEQLLPQLRRVFNKP